MKAAKRLASAIVRVVEAENCSGYGGCALLDSGIGMSLDGAGFSRPRRIGASDAQVDATARFRRFCPGEDVRSQKSRGSWRHPIMGSYFVAYEAWAVDDAVRFVRSSGGALTALAAWMVEIGEAAQMLGAGVDEQQPRRTVSASITTRDQALALAGSRYDPVLNASERAALNSATVVVGKPCEVSAIRALHRTAVQCGGTAAPILLSFFCAGTSSQHATDTLVESLGVPSGEPIRELWYRGRGWTGRFTVIPVEGPQASESYDESWGSTLGPATQWRCKICDDGVGGSSDVTGADFWHSDECGYPDFSDGEGVSALFARTPRVLDLIARAIVAGVLVANPIQIDDLARTQPLHREHRETLFGRMLGVGAAGARTPRYRGCGLLTLGLARPRVMVRAARGTRRRRLALGVRID